MSSAAARDLLAAAALSALLFAAGALLPLLGVLPGFFAAVPLVLVAARRGPLPAAGAAALAAGALLAAGMPPVVALLYAGEHGLPGVWLGTRLGRGGRLFPAAAAAAVAVTAAGVVAVTAWSRAAGIAPVEVIARQLGEAVRLLGGGLGGQTGGRPSPEELPAIAAGLLRIAPGLALVGLFLEYGLNGLVAMRALLRSGQPGVRTPDLLGFRLPEPLVWGFIASLALALAPLPAAAAVGRNVALPLAVLYLVQGLAVTLHLAVRLRLSRLATVLIAAALVLQPFLLAVPFLLGVLDFRFDFRRLGGGHSGAGPAA